MNKLLGMLGLIRRAGKLEAGYDAAVLAIRSGRAAGAAACADISDKTCKNLWFEADRAGIPAVKLNVTSAAAGKAVGKRAGVFAICDKGFFKAVAEYNVNDERVPADQAGVR